MSAHGDSNNNDDVRFEPTDVPSRPVVLSVLTLAVFTVLFTLVAHFVYYQLASREQATSQPASPLAAQYAAKEPPAPRLQVDPKKDLDDLRAAEDRILGNYAWVDRDKGVVQVPIDRAMEMLVAKGLPARQAPVPWRMAPRGVAPSQPAEAAGAPDWTGWSHDMAGGHAAEGGPDRGHGAPDNGHGKGTEAHGH